MTALRTYLFRQLDTEAWTGRGLSPVNRLVAAVVTVSVLSVILETEETLSVPYADVFEAGNLVLVTLFSVEYAARLWAMGERPEYAGLRGRLRFMLTPAALIDLLAIVPFFFEFLGSDVFLLRLFRLARILALAKLGRYTTAMRHVRKAIVGRRYELGVSVMAALVILLIASTAMYLVEGGDQPEAFGSIPRAMWWAIATLTTVGYGDVYPVTALGRLLGGITALASLGLVALPAGILAGAFTEAFQESRKGRGE
jgi:voltage-gated potassium channel